jgi:hypothetical protein
MRTPFIAMLGGLLLALAATARAETRFSYGGSYYAWAQSQHAFTFNGDTYDDNYVVQELRLNLSFAPGDNLKVVTRFDMGQGWWGVDNEPRSAQRTDSGGDRGGAGSSSALFDFKDTNFLLHVDHAYLDFKLPGRPVGLRVGRQNYSLGNRLMVDNNYDGVQLDLNEVVGDRLTLSWARVSEGGDNLSDLEGGGVDNRDADLFTLNLSDQVNALTYNAFALFYQDRSTADGTAYVPDLLQFSQPRFSPQVTQLTALGLAGKYTRGRLSLDGEFDYLRGKDDIANPDHGAAQKWDLNNGDLSGYNLYLKASHQTAPRLALGAVVGLGSGDGDLTRGSGNVNKLRTSGFFYLTEIWEDSIMPDEEGITPQGLGAPNVRGYRELENTTALQLNATFKPREKLECFGSYTLLRATQEVHAWTAAGGIDPNTSASDLGNEVDFNLSYLIDKGLSAQLRGGYFIPGDAALYLINGSAAADDPAWELKGLITCKF